MNLETSIGKIKFKNPVLVASGTFGYAEEFGQFFDLKKLGGIVTKTVTMKPRVGNAPPRVVETPSGMLNAIGLQNPGADIFLKEKLPFLNKLGLPVIASVMAYSPDELTELVARLDGSGGIHGYELNLSCPNVAYQNAAEGAAPKMFAHDPGMVRQAVSAARRSTKKTLVAKLSPEVSDIVIMARAAEEAGADGLSLINTFSGMVIDVRKRKPVLGNRTGGLSGPCIRPLAVRMVWQVYKHVKIPILGIGGIMNARDALEFMIAGASAVEVGTASFIDPCAAINVLNGIKDFMKKEKIGDIKELIGSVKD